MDLENMQKTWNDLSLQIEQQKLLTREIILKMAHEKSFSRISRIVYLESFGSIISLIGIIYLLLNFHKLGNWLELAGGIGTLFIMFFSILLASMLIQRARAINILNDSYQETLFHFNRFCKLLHFYKWISIGLYIVMPVFVMPVVYSLFLGLNLLDEKDTLVVTGVMIIILLPFIWYIFYRFYAKNISQVKKAINDTNR